MINNKKKRFSQKKSIVICFLLFCIMIFMVSCQSNTVDSQSNESIRWEANNSNASDNMYEIPDDGCYITNALLVKEGVVETLDESKYKELEKDFLKSSDVLINDDKTKFSWKYSFEPGKTKLTYDYENKCRVSQLYENVTFLPITSECKCNRSVLAIDNIPDKNYVQTVIDDEISDKYGLQTSGVSYISQKDNEGFLASSKYRYSAIVFLPAVNIVKGTYKVSKFFGLKDVAEYKVTMKYPQVNKAGVMDGLFLLVESNDESSLSKIKFM